MSSSVNNKDELGDRMKKYEEQSSSKLLSRSYHILRLDGRGFHNYCKDMIKPYDADFMNDMDNLTIDLCNEISGSIIGYVQSDEISILMSNRKAFNTELWFGGKVQKIVSVSASFAAAYLNKARSTKTDNLAMFDARVFTLPDTAEVVNYFHWRQADCTRNSVSSSTRNLYSTKEMHGKSVSDMHEMLFNKGVNWNDYPVGFKRGRVIVKRITPISNSDLIRSKFKIEDPPVFSTERHYILDAIEEASK